MPDECKTVTLKVIIQENGIIRRKADGIILGRIGDDITFNELDIPKNPQRQPQGLEGTKIDDGSHRMSDGFHESEFNRDNYR